MKFLFLELDSEIDLSKIMTYLHFYEFNSLQSQYNICFAKQMLLMIISNATFLYNIFYVLFNFLVTISNVHSTYSFV